MAKVKSGLEVLIEQKLSLVQGRRVGLVTNHSAVNRNLIHIIEVLASVGVKITTLFGPEHGVRGDMPEGKPVPSGVDARTGVPIHSLYGQNRKPTPEMLANTDVVVFDLQDIGCRYYTYVYTMAYVMQACVDKGKKFIVLDRPNPINGSAIEGNVLDPKFASFVGLFPILSRHGMTIGELAKFINGQFGIAADLEVVFCQGWKRAMWWDETGLPWVMPSPNVPTPETAVVYPGLCLLEGTNVSEGRGTTKPFEIFGAPWIDANKLSDKLNGLFLAGVYFRPVYFIPTASKHAGQRCGGVQAHVTERAAFRPVEMGLHVIKTLREMHPREFQLLPPGQTGKYFFDYLAGTDRTRLQIEMGASVEEIVASWYASAAEFARDRKSYLLYM